jgi:hypothetical protein
MFSLSKESFTEMTMNEQKVLLDSYQTTSLFCLYFAA